MPRTVLAGSVFNRQVSDPIYPSNPECTTLIPKVKCLQMTDICIQYAAASKCQNQAAGLVYIACLGVSDALDPVTNASATTPWIRSSWMCSKCPVYVLCPFVINPMNQSHAFQLVELVHNPCQTLLVVGRWWNLVTVVLHWDSGLLFWPMKC